jgi:hypothetical protein
MTTDATAAHPAVGSRPRPSRSARFAAGRWGGWLAAAAAGAAGWLVLWLWTPSADPEASICLLRRVLVPCPGCGGTRALALLAKGQWAAALTLHPLAVLLAAEALLAWLGWGIVLASGRRPRLPASWIGTVAVLHVVLFVVLWAARLSTGTLPP